MVQVNLQRRKGKVLPQRFKRAMQRRTIVLMQGAIQAFLIEAAKHIKVDTGMSIGSLIPVSRFIGQAFPIIAGKRSRRGYMVGFNRGSWVSGATKDVGTGESLSQQGDNWNVDYGTQNRFRMEFRFRAVVFQHILHDNGLGGQAPWKSISKGQAAFIQYITSNSSELVPRFNEYVVYG